MSAYSDLLEKRKELVKEKDECSKKVSFYINQCQKLNERLPYVPLDYSFIEDACRERDKLVMVQKNKILKIDDTLKTLDIELFELYIQEHKNNESFDNYYLKNYPKIKEQFDYYTMKRSFEEEINKKESK